MESRRPTPQQLFVIVGAGASFDVAFQRFAPVTFDKALEGWFDALALEEEMRDD